MISIRTEFLAGTTSSGVRFGIIGLEFTANFGDFTGECRRIPKT
jgi:hypothetical protein